ncbi:ABC transporter permease [Criibacterium bergeronii]|uniref:ABC transporter permease n=1 Tax=Criibacterium bergeronii TaxID=1871336 RepID=A0A371IKW0_9FIRM|nr:ABC transporter permease [Criibacterium bergeronii]MBS6063216.1 ABC transporter permease [Peptostreptococcaceae bacterium]RDY21090.1 ABC transporter permease [Criibacterium bergeronii]
MTKKQESITDRLSPYIAVVGLLVIWQIFSDMQVVPKYLLPSPTDVIKAFIADYELIFQHTRYTMVEAFAGLGIGFTLGFILAILMDLSIVFKKMFYPLVIITQTIPTVAIAPLLVIWLGYGLTPKITLVAITSFFPVLISMTDGMSSVDNDSINLIRAMGANKYQIYAMVKLPASLKSLFSGLRISLSYAIIGAVVAEWLGGFNGIGVYMTRVRKSYAFDKMFAVIFFISALSLISVYLLKLLEKKLIKYE